MIVELGHFSLILALCVAAAQAYYPLVGASKNKPHMIAVARPAAILQTVLLGFTFTGLTYAFVSHDFSVSYVAQHSNSALPLHYRISAVWGGHEGSLLLWALILSLWSCAVALLSKSLPNRFVARVIGVMGLISVGFLLFMLLTSNPFTRLFPAPMEGRDLNPLLQDFGLVVHPPMLYMGYVGFSVAFSFAVAALLEGRFDSNWVRWSRPWTLVAWIFLTLGIALGSWWAYYELGWGGWWFWDPVENASFMPWLSGTALLHSLAVSEKRGVLKSWTVLLAICTFSLSLLGTFLVRSGVLTSVHAFATDPTRGVFILVFLGAVSGGALILYAARAPGNLTGTPIQFQSREAFLLFNNVLLITAMCSILLGTIYPLIVDALGLGKLSVGHPYFNTVFIPIVTAILVLMIPGTLLRWKNDNFKRLLSPLVKTLLLSLILACLLLLPAEQPLYWQALLGLTLALWVVLGAVILLRERLSGYSGAWQKLRRQPRSFWGMWVAHLGVAVMVVGVTLSSLYSQELHTRMSPGEEIPLGGYSFRMENAEIVKGPNYDAAQVRFTAFKGDSKEAVLTAEKRRYLVQTMPMTEAGIDPGFTRDIYVALGEVLDDGSWSVRLYYKPFVRWIWLGAIFMVVGGFCSALDKRYRWAKDHIPQESGEIEVEVGFVRERLS